MPINSQHPEYKNSVENWNLVNDVINNAAKSCILTDKDMTSNDASLYKDRAILTNFTALTKEGLTGLVMRRDPHVKIPTTIEYLKEDATGDSRGLSQLAKQSLSEVMKTGRMSYLVDYPRNTGGTSIRDTEDLKARILPYNAVNIINWNVERINNKAVIQWIVLWEPTLELKDDDQFEWTPVDKYRLLKLDENGNYFQTIYVKSKKNTLVDTLQEEEGAAVYPTDINGNNLTEIPFTFVGAQDNNESVDKAPILDLALLNIAHYRNSADYEASCYNVGQAMVVLSADIDPETFKTQAPGGIKMSSNRGLILPAGSNASLLQSNPNQLVDEAMKSKLKQAAYIGARLISEPGGRETAEAARLRFSSQNSALHTIVLNVDDALIKAMEFCILFMGGDVEAIEFKLNRQFYDESADPQLIAQSIMLFDRGLISREEIRDDLKQKNVLDVDKTIEELDEELANTDPFINNTGESDGNTEGSKGEA